MSLIDAAAEIAKEIERREREMERLTKTWRKLMREIPFEPTPASNGSP